MREFVAGASESGQRLDKFLKKLLPGAPLSLIYKLGRTNRAKVDGKKRENDYRLTEGEIVKIFLSDAEFEEYGRQAPSAKPDPGKVGESKKFRLTPDRVLFEDEHLIAINKPAGLNVHPGDHKSDENSLIEAVSDYLESKFDTLTFRPSLVHRIDRDTSGVILIAKTKRALDRLLSALQNDKMDKTYAAISARVPSPPRATVRKKLLRVENAKNEAKVRVDESGQPAVTHYATLKQMEKYALLEVRIETGRTHQIRVHLASVGAPILGDRAYGDASENSHAKRKFGVSRQMLHAWKLAFPHPETGKEITVTAPFEPDMRKLVEGE